MKRLFLSFVALLVSSPAWAQLDPGEFVAWQGGHEVGHVFVPAGDTCRYTEIWFFTAGYSYPTVANRLTLTITPSRELGFDSSERFVAAMLDAHPDGTWIQADSVETRRGCP
ncbi:MAG: hypothetical protein V4850_14255 [Myxococcota bacterium]